MVVEWTCRKGHCCQAESLNSRPGRLVKALGHHTMQPNEMLDMQCTMLVKKPTRTSTRILTPSLQKSTALLISLEERTLMLLMTNLWRMMQERCQWATCAARHWGSGPHSEGEKTPMVWTWNAPMVQSRQPLTYRLMESVGLGGPRWQGNSWQRGIAESGSSRPSTLMIDIPGDLVWDLPCVQQASYLEGSPLVWMLPLYLHINQKSDYDDDDILSALSVLVQKQCKCTYSSLNAKTV